MHRRRYLVLASTVLVAGCQSDGGDETPTRTATATETATATPTETATATASPTETETATEMATETQSALTPGEAITNARDDLAAAHDAYLQQGGGTDSLMAVGPATMGFDEEPIRDLASQATAGLSVVDEDGSENQRADAEELRTAARWFRAAATMQGAMSATVGSVDSAGVAAANDETYAAIIEHFEAARRPIQDVRDAKPRLNRPGARTFKQVSGIGRDAATEKHNQLHREAVAFDSFDGALGDTITEVERLETASELIAEDEGDDAESAADRAHGRLGQIRRRVEGFNPDSFSAVASVYSDTVDELQTIAEELAEQAEDL